MIVRYYFIAHHSGQFSNNFFGQNSICETLFGLVE